MKKIHIAALITMLIAVALLVMSTKEISSYASFEIAEKSNSRVKIVGQLDKSIETYYNPEEDPNYFAFNLIDVNGVTKKVVLSQPKPRDFEMSEQIVVTGSMNDDTFMADEVLLKCPSKYKEEELALRKQG